MYARSAANDDEEEDFEEVDVEWDDDGTLNHHFKGSFLDYHTLEVLHMSRHLVDLVPYSRMSSWAASHTQSELWNTKFPMKC